MASLGLRTLADLALAPLLPGLVEALWSSASKKSSKSMSSSSSSSEESPTRRVPLPVPFLVAGCLVDFALVFGAIGSSSEPLISSVCYFFFGGILINLFKV